jgi:hypothetical protein
MIFFFMILNVEINFRDLNVSARFLFLNFAKMGGFDAKILSQKNYKEILFYEEIFAKTSL